MREIDWHPWFAWYPVVTESGYWRWLCWVQCRKAYPGPRTAATGNASLMIWTYK